VVGTAAQEVLAVLAAHSSSAARRAAAHIARGASTSRPARRLTAATDR
jgi:hypothetical protein